LRDGQAIVDVLPAADPASSAGSGTLAAVQAAAGTSVQIGGPQASSADFVDAVYGSSPVMIALIAVVTLLLLARAFGSVLLPLKGSAAERDLGRRCLGRDDARVAGRHRVQRPVRIPATGAITEWVPLMFAF